MMLSDIHEILKQFEPINLKQIDGVRLMDRTDTKFTFKLTQLVDLLSKLTPYYKCLVVEQKSMCSYQTLYYDTPNFLFYNEHHSGKLNRIKIRHRTYVDSKQGYLEVKWKNNKGRTIKERIKSKQAPLVFEQKEFAFLKKELPLNPELLAPKVWINYTRITLVNKSGAERVTIDLNLQFKKNNEELNFKHLVIAEVKQEKRKISPFITLMKEMRIQEGSISKYCFAINFMYNHVKKNNFKSKLLSLKKIINYDLMPSNNNT